MKVKKISNRTLLVRSNLAYEEIKQLQIMAPEALTLADEHNVAVFKVAVGDESTISRFGIIFDDQTPSGKAQMTINATEDLTKEDVMRIFGRTFAQLQQVEHQANNIIAQVRQDFDLLYEEEVE